jgi:hypothetical protein
MNNLDLRYLMNVICYALIWVYFIEKFCFKLPILFPKYHPLPFSYSFYFVLSSRYLLTLSFNQSMP